MKENADEFTSDVLYIESMIGTFSIADIFPFENEVEKKEKLVYLQIKQDKIKNIINKP